MRVVDKKFIGDLIGSYGAQAGVLVLNFAFMILVTKSGGIEVYGQFVLLRSLSGMLGALLSFRTSEALVAFYGRAYRQQEFDKCKLALVLSFVLDSLLGFFLFASFALFSQLIAGGYLKDIELANLLPIYGLYAFTSAMQSTSLGFLQAIQRIHYLNGVRIAEQILRVVLAWAATLGGNNISLYEVVLSCLVASFVTLVISYAPFVSVLVKKYLHVKITWSRSWTASYFKFSGITFLSSTFKAGNQNLDTFAVGVMTDPVLAGVYSTMKQFLLPIAFLSSPISAISYPRFISLAAQGKINEVREVIRFVNFRLLIVTSIFAVLLVPVFWGYVHLLDIPSLSGIYVAFATFCVQATLHSLLWWSRPFSNSTRPVTSLVANALAAGSLVALIYPLVSLFGLAGAAASMLAVTLALLLYWNVMLNARTGTGD